MKNIGFKKWLAMGLLMAMGLVGWSQGIANYRVPYSGLVSDTLRSGETCMIYDHGGVNGSYDNNADGSLVIYAADGLDLIITGFCMTENSVDVLEIYDASNFSGMHLGSYSGNQMISDTCHSGAVFLRFYSDGNRTSSGFALQVECCAPNVAITNVVETIVSSHEAWISWTDNSMAMQWIVEYGLSSNALVHRDTVNNTNIRLTNLLDGKTYYYKIHSVVGGVAQPGTTIRSFNMPFVDISLCDDFTALNTFRVQGTYGDCQNPYQNQGIMDMGNWSGYSSHTVHDDTAEYDVRTGGGLRTIPEGELASVRLGNWLPTVGFGGDMSGGAESITYIYDVDTSIYDMLVMKYATVLQQTTNASDAGAQFRFRILNNAMEEILPECYSINVVPGVGVNWHQRGNVWWKDWTTVGIDMTQWHGQRIYIEMSTSDGQSGDAYGYAYFTLGCSNKVIRAEGCGNVVENEFTAPSGFNYRWYNEANPDSIISVEQQISVTEGGVYKCEMSMLGATGSNCGIEMTVVAGFRYPYAQFNYQEVGHRCAYDVQFHNQSVVAHNATHTSLTAEACESAEWNFGDGTTSTEINPRHVYASEGVYTVRLIAAISEGLCADTIIKDIHVGQFCNVVDSISDTICMGGIYPFYGRELTTAGVYQHDGDSGLVVLTLYQEPLIESSVNDTIVENQLPWNYNGRVYVDSVVRDSVCVKTPLGCDSLIWYSLCVHRNVWEWKDSVVCDNDFPIVWNGIVFEGPRTDTMIVAGVGAYGVDSMICYRVVGALNPTAIDRDTIVENELPYSYRGEWFDAGIEDTIFVVPNAVGCDSLVHFGLWVVSNDTLEHDTTLCENEFPFVWHGMTIDCGGDYDSVWSGVGRYGEDSVYRIHVNELLNSYVVRSDTCNDSELPYVPYEQYPEIEFWNTVLDTVLVLPNGAGCDSIVDYSLLVQYNVAVHLDSAVCEGNFPFTWNGKVFMDTGVDSIKLENRGAVGRDSTIYMHVTKLLNSSVRVMDTIVENQLVGYAYMGLHFDSCVVDSLLMGTNAVGCDSIVDYSLHIYWNDTIYVDTVLCENNLPLRWHDRNFDATATERVKYMGVNGQDSVYVMEVAVLDNSEADYGDTIVENELPYSYAGYVFDSVVDDSLLIIQNSVGCDSNIHFSLAVHWNAELMYEEVICEDELPYEWYGEIFEGAEVRVLNLRDRFGADSVVTLKLEVKPTYEVDDSVTICEGTSYQFGAQTCVDAGEYREVLQSMDGCDSVVTLQLSVWPQHHYIDHQVICKDSSYTWQNGETYLLPTTTPTITFEDVNGCDSIVHLDLIKDPIEFEAVIRALPDLVTYEMHEVQLEDESYTSHGVLNRRWYMMDEISEEPYLTYIYPLTEDSVLVKLTVTNDNQCKDSDYKWIKKYRTYVMVPNVFTPGETMNNRFKVEGVDIETFDIEIYDRGGSMVYKSNDIAEGWDGTKHGTMCLQGAYVYRIRYSAKDYPKRMIEKVGTVTLLR